MASDDTGPGPVVSVVIPAYNVERYIGKAIESVLAQTFSAFELIVVDDGSQDGTAQLAARYADERVRLLQKPNGGLSSARNAGIDAARGRYIAFLDADDFWLPEKLAVQVALLDENPSLAFCSTFARVENPSGEIVQEWTLANADDDTLRRLFHENGSIPGSGSGVMVRSTSQRQAGYFDETLRSLEDVDMWMRLAALGGYRCIEKFLTVILKRDDSMSRNLSVMRESMLAVMRKNRRLLSAKDQGHFWRDGLAAALIDYAKWELRAGARYTALLHSFQAFLYSPVTKGRWSAGLCIDILLRRCP